MTILIIIASILIIIFLILLLSFKIKIYRRADEKFNADMFVFGFKKWRIDLDEMAEKFVENKSTKELIESFINTVKLYKKNKSLIYRKLKKVDVVKITVIPEVDIDDLFAGFFAYQFINYIKYFVDDNFAKVEDEYYYVKRTENSKINYNFELVLRVRLITLLTAVISYFIDKKKGEKYERASN